MLSKKPRTKNKRELTIGDRIRVIREYMVQSRPTFADMLDVPSTTIKNYELGYRQVPASLIQQIGKELGADCMVWVMGFGTDNEAVMFAKLKGHPKFGAGRWSNQ